MSPKNKIGVFRLSTLPKSVVFALLMTVYLLSFVITPYWDLPGESEIEIVIREVTIALGIIWSALGASEVQVERSKFNLKSFIPLLFIIFILNFSPLISVIPWRGDEDRHIQKTLDLLYSIPWHTMVIGAVTWGLIIYLSRIKPKWSILLGIVLLIFFVINSPQFNEIEYSRDLVRYPYISYWFFAFVVNIFTPFINHQFHEILFRIIPFLTVVFLCWTYQQALSRNQIVAVLPWGIAVTLIPSIYYYTSILYLEMPVILLMTVVCLRLEKILKLDYPKLKQDPGWYALLLIGFLKETTLPFILCFLLFRTAIIIVSRIGQSQLSKKNGHTLQDGSVAPVAKLVKEEALVYFLLLLPIVYYFMFRLRFNPREYQLTLVNLVDPTIYPVILRSLFDQFGAWIFLFIAGGIILGFKKEFSLLLFYLSLFFGYILFFALDQKLYIGYSRFFLFLLPPILAGASYLIKFTMKKRKLISYALVTIVIFSSILLSPIQRDGTKVPYWGNYFFDTAEHYYPVEEAITWLMENDPDNSVLFAGNYYRYFYDFYFIKHKWRPIRYELLLSDVNEQDDQMNLEAAITKAKEDGFNNILFFVLGKEIPQPPENSKFGQRIVFSNMSHTLVLYTFK